MMIALFFVPAVLSALAESPSLMAESSDNVTESLIKFETKRENRKVLVYKESSGEVDIITRSQITYSYYDPVWTVIFSSTNIQTLTWWVVNQETNVITATNSDATTKVGILTGVVCGIIVVLLILNAFGCGCARTFPHRSESPNVPETPQTTPDMTPDEIEAMAIQNGGLAPAQPYTPVTSPLAPIPEAQAPPAPYGAPTVPYGAPATDAYPVPPDARQSTNPYAPPPANPYDVPPGGVPPPPVDADPDQPPNPYDQPDNADWD